MSKDWNVLNRDEFVYQYSRNCSGLKILDIGAGSAPYRNYFERDNEYITQDLKPLEDHQLRDGGYSQIDLVSDITNIPIESSSIDLIICTEVLEHVPLPVDALYEMIRLLKSGGTILLTAPLQSGLHQTPFHFYGGYTPFFYKYFLDEFFEELEIQPNGNSFDFAEQEVRRAAYSLRKHGRGIGRLINLILSLPLYLSASLLRKLSHRRLLNSTHDFVVGYHVLAKNKK